MVLKGGYDKGEELEPEYSKKCTNCGKLKDKTEFEVNQIQAGDRLVRRGECKECRSWKKPINQKQKDLFIKNNPKPKVGKNFLCPVCNKTKPVFNNKSIALDHDHHTGEIRGYICLACNTGMGQLKDDPIVLKRAIDWLNKSFDNVGNKK